MRNGDFNKEERLLTDKEINEVVSKLDMERLKGEAQALDYYDFKLASEDTITLNRKRVKL